jgi:hypothetical protein
MSTLAKLIVTVAFAAVAAWAALEASSFPQTGRLMPLFGALLMMIFAALHAVHLVIDGARERRSTRVPAKKGTAGPAPLGEGHMQDLPPVGMAARYLFGWLFACLVLIALLGAWIGAVVFLGAFIWRELPDERRYFFVITSIVLLVTAVMVFVLDIRVPTGQLLQLL